MKTLRKHRIALLISSICAGIAGANVTLPFNGAMPDQAGLINTLNGINPFMQTAYSNNTATAAATLLGATIGDGQNNYVNMTGTLAAAAALTLPTAALMIASLPATAQIAGASAVMRILNSGAGAFSWTVTAAAGWTLNGTMSIAQNTWRDFIWTVTAVGASPAITLQQVGTGTTS